MLRNVSDCEILCYDPAVIPMMALLQPCRFIFFLLEKQFDLIRSTMPAYFLRFSIFTNTRLSSPVLTAIMLVFWTCHLGIWNIDLLPTRGILINTFQTKSVWGQRFHRAPTAVLYCFEECRMNFVVNLLLAESGIICLLQWTENCSITSLN
jgi:hypothetical protein